MQLPQPVPGANLYSSLPPQYSFLGLSHNIHSWGLATIFIPGA